MVSEYSSKAISLGIANLLSGLGVAIREFADQQSWFSVVPAFILLFGVLVILAFKVNYVLAVNHNYCKIRLNAKIAHSHTKDSSPYIVILKF